MRSLPDENSAINIICGEHLLWDHFGGVPLRLKPEYLFKVLFKACRGKGYYPEDFDKNFES